MRYECRFVAFAALRDRGKEGCIGFDQQPIERQLADDLTLLFRVFIRDGSGDADIEIELQRFLCGFEIAIVGM